MKNIHLIALCLSVLSIPIMASGQLQTANGPLPAGTLEVMNVENKSPALSQLCLPSTDQSSSMEAKDCFKHFGAQTPICELQDYESSYNQSWLEHNWFDMQYRPQYKIYSIEIPKTKSGDTWLTWERVNIYKDLNTGEVSHIGVWETSSNGTTSPRKQYWDPSKKRPQADTSGGIEYSTEAGLDHTGLTGATVEEQKAAFDAMIADYTQKANLKDCDFMAKSDPVAPFQSDETPVVSDEEGAGQAVAASGTTTAGASTEKPSSWRPNYNSCLNDARPLVQGEMQGITCRLGLSPAFAEAQVLAGQVTSATYLSLLTATALKEFALGYVALTGSDPDIGKIIKQNPACGSSDLKDVLKGVVGDTASTGLLKDDYTKRMTPGSDYLKAVRAEAIMKPDHAKLGGELPTYSMAELLALDETCSALATRETMAAMSVSRENAQSRFAAARMQDAIAKESKASGCEVYSTQKDAIASEIRNREALFPILSNDYDAEKNDKLWASAYDMHAGRKFLTELAKNKYDDPAKLSALVQKHTKSYAKHTQELISDTCSGTDMNCTDRTKMCWHNLIGMKGLTDAVGKSSPLSFDSIDKCLQREKEGDLFLNNAGSMAIGLGCGVIGVSAGLATGGVLLPATLATAGVLCGVGAYFIYDSKGQTLALSDFELTRACSQVSEYCTEEQVKESADALWWAIFGKKASLIGNAVGTAGEVVGLGKLFLKVPAGMRGVAADVVAAEVRGLDEASQLVRARQILEELATHPGALDEAKLALGLDLGEDLGMLERFLGTPKEKQLEMLRKSYPDLDEATLKGMLETWTSMKDPRKVASIMKLAKSKNPAEIKEAMRMLSEAPDDEFGEQVVAMFIMSKNPEKSGMSPEAVTEFEKLLHEDPKIMAKLERAAALGGC